MDLGGKFGRIGKSEPKQSKRRLKAWENKQKKKKDVTFCLAQTHFWDQGHSNGGRKIHLVFTPEEFIA